MVKAAYSSGKPAYGVGAGNATMVIDETANIEEAARNTRISKTNDNGSGCSADGNLLVDASIYDALLAQLQIEGGYLVNDAGEGGAAAARIWDAEGAPHAGHDRVAPQQRRQDRRLHDSRGRKTSSSSRRRHRQGASCSPARSSARCWRSSSTTASTRRSTWCGRSTRSAARATRAASTRSTTTTSTGSRWSRRSAASWCGRCSRSANAGTFTNGMPMTSSMGCGIWGGNITNENIRSSTT